MSVVAVAYRGWFFEYDAISTAVVLVPCSFLWHACAAACAEACAVFFQEFRNGVGRGRDECVVKQGLRLEERARGNRARGNRALGNRALGNRARGNRARGNRDRGNRVLGNRPFCVVINHKHGRLRKADHLGNRQSLRTPGALVQIQKPHCLRRTLDSKLSPKRIPHAHVRRVGSVVRSVLL